MASIEGVRLPQEVWENIFRFLTTSDVINFCKTNSKYQHFLYEKNIVKDFDISKTYDFIDTDLCAYIKENVAYRYIKRLNINKLYWVDLVGLRHLLKKLTNLEELLALHTKLSFRPKDVKLYGKLKTLALTVEEGDFDVPDPLLYKNNLYLLKRLCLHLSLKHRKGHVSMYRIFSDLFALQELWICDTDDSVTHPIRYDALVVQLKFLTKLVIISKVNIPFLDYKPFSLAKYFETRRFKSIVMRYERLPSEQIIPFKDVSIFEPCGTQLEKAWNVLRAYRSEMPYDSLVHREIYLTKSIANAKFEELNFFHNKCFCAYDYITATLDFLKSDNSKDLRKLSIKSCVLQRQAVPKGNTLDRLARTYPILDVIEKCKKVNTLELMHCLNCNVTIIDSYPFICNWEHLERLTLEVPSGLSGKFLVDLIINRPLKYLRLISHHTNENLNRNVYRALPFATQLEDFCYENKHINLPALFDSLKQISPSKLRRLFISCDDADGDATLHLNPMREFLAANPQLVFFYLAVFRKTKKYMQAVQEVMSSFEKEHPAKRYFAKRLQVFLGNFPIPTAHKELLSFDTEVSAIDIYNFR